MPTYDYKIEQLEKDAARWRWLTNDCDGDAQDDFTRWLAGTVASKADIDAKIDEAMAVPNAELCGVRSTSELMELKAAKVGAGRTATVTREMITAAHGVTLESGDVVLSARLLERIYLAMEQAAPPPQTPFDACPTCEALARTVMMDQTGAA